jgi:hypothetical protein
VTGAAYQPLAAELRFEAANGSDEDRALVAFEELHQVAAPLALTLLLGGYEEGTHWRDDVDPADSSWQIVERGLPERIVIDWPQDPNLHRSDVAVMDRAAVAGWLRSALAQPPPRDGYTVGLSLLQCAHIRAPVADPGPDPDGYRLVHAEGILDLPLEEHDGRPYVLAPADGLALLPPVGWTIARTGLVLRLDVTVNWSPWLAPDRPEGAATRAAAERLRGRGWTLVEPVPALELEA